jgi:hypothetical protein
MPFRTVAAANPESPQLRIVADTARTGLLECRQGIDRDSETRNECHSSGCSFAGDLFDASFTPLLLRRQLAFAGQLTFLRAWSRPIEYSRRLHNAVPMAMWRIYSSTDEIRAILHPRRCVSSGFTSIGTPLHHWDVADGNRQVCP